MVSISNLTKRNNLLLVLYLLLLPSESYAYIDLGTGAYAVQAIVGIVGAFIFYIQNPRKFIKFLAFHLTNIKKRIFKDKRN